MGRLATGSVRWRGNPPRWWARLTVVDKATGTVKRPWVDLEIDAPNTPEGRKAAQRLALKHARVASTKSYVGVAKAMAPSVKLSELEERWFALLDVDPQLKPGTRTAYKSCWNTNVRPRLGGRRVSELSVPVLRAWVRELTGELSPSSVRNNAITLTRCLSDARAEGWIVLESGNPMKHEDVRSMLPTVEAPDAGAIVQWTRAQVEQLIALATLPHDRFGLYLVAFLTGLRAGELRGLTFAHVAHDAPIPMLRVRQQLGLAREAGEAPSTGSPKTRSSKRDVPLHPAALAWLTWWRDSGWSAHYGRERADDSPVFPAVDGEAGRPRDPQILRRDLLAAKLPEQFTTEDGERVPYTFHATRRTFSRLLADNGVSSEIVGMLDGHAAQGVTEAHYMGRSLETMARAVATLTLKLPDRPGVERESTPARSESSPESSPEKKRPNGTPAKSAKLAAVSHEHPIELPQLRHL